MSRLKITILTGAVAAVASLAGPALAQSAPTELDRLAVVLAAIHEDPSAELLEDFRPGLYEKLASIEADGSRLRLARLRALGAMAKEDGARAMPRVLAVLDDPRAQIRLRLGAAWALGHPLADRPEAIPALQRTLQDADPGLRERAVLSLAEIGTPRALQVIEAHRFIERDVVVRMALRKLAAARRGVAPEALPREGHRTRPLLRRQTKASQGVSQPVIKNLEVSR